MAADLTSLCLSLGALLLAAAVPPDSPPPADPLKALRERMVDEQVAARHVKDAAVLQAMREVPRHL
ncbi:MAG TPA: hypothetical protein VMM92_02550, partial [Thermoanaerobaculia bacterium]|nr:hypothetical protein [Thermoanaerobaculia bacterium]